MKPWTGRTRVASALRNEHVVLGERAGMGRGLYAAQAFAAGDPVAAYNGRIVSRAELFALHGSDRALFERINEYAVATPSGAHLFADDASAVGAHLINHSCGPNATWAEWDRGSLIVRAARPIARGEEITIHYGWVGMKATMEKRWHGCLCAAPFCTGTIELRLEWVEGESANEGGPFLPPEEVTRRFAADIVNGTDDHERLLLRYKNDSMSFVHGAEVLATLDQGAFFEKLRAGAREAVASARHPNASERRRRQIAARYELGSVP